MIIGKKIIHYKEIDSTNDEARRLIKKGEGEGLVLIADVQLKGKGKPGRIWHSPPGNLYLSAVVKPFKNPQELSSITLLGTRAVINAIDKTCGLKGEIKKPNDVILNGKKIGGILVERLSSGHLILGVGVNLNNFPEEVKGTATSLKKETGEEIPVKEFFAILISALDNDYLEYLKKV